MNWIRNIATQEIKDDIYNYLANNLYSEESKNYAKNVIEEIRTTTANPLLSTVTLIDGDSDNEIANIVDYLKCFNLNQPATFTLYVDQPTSNSNTPWSGIPGTNSFSVGHTFVGIKQGNITRVLGFYPKDDVTLDTPAGIGVCENDSGHPFDVAISYNISSAQLNTVINYISVQANSQYNLNTYNCSDFGMTLAKKSGVALPSAYGTWGNWATGSGAGDNPGQLGQNIRNLPANAEITKITSSGNAPTNSGNCN